MKNKLFNTDYVIYNPITAKLVRWSNDNDVIIFGNLQEVLADCREEYGEQVVSCTDLPEELQKLVLDQINDDSSSNDSSFIIGRAIGGTSLNGLEHVMKDGDYQRFSSRSEAMDFLRSFYGSLTDDELEESFVIETFNGNEIIHQNKK